MTMPIGKQIGRYQLLELIGSGGIASVYQGYDPKFERHVAIKLLHTPFLIRDEFRQRFLREAQATARLSHPGIIEVLDFGETEEHQLYIVMELVRGPNLEQLLSQWRAEQRPLPLPEAVSLMRQLAEATAFANEHGVLHRDLKPANILLKPRWPAHTGETLSYDPLITDFGLARLEGGSDVTQPGVSIGGTPAYMAPEQLGNDPIDERCDLYSLGVIFYEVVTGQLPFQLKTLHDALRQHALNSIPLKRPKLLRPELPDAMDTLILRMIEPDRSRRLPSSRALAQALSDKAVGSQPNRAALDHTVSDLTVPDLSVSDMTMSDMTVADFTVPTHQTPDRPTSRSAPPVNALGKTGKARAAQNDPNLTIGVDPALTLVTPQPQRWNGGVLALTLVMIVIAAALIWYFVSRSQGGVGVPASVATSTSTIDQGAATPAVAPTDSVEASGNGASSTVTSSVALGDSPTVTLTEALSETVTSETSELIMPTQVLTATVIGAETSHPTELWMDGDPTDWQVLRALSKSQTTHLDVMVDIEGSSGCQARYPGSSAAVDLGADVQFAYNDTNLYVSFLVQDDGYVANAELSKYEQGDAPQLLLKMNLTSESTLNSEHEDEYQIDLLPGTDQVGESPAAAIRSLARPDEIRSYSEASIASSVIKDGYFVEAALPWSTLGASPPDTGAILGVVPLVSDSDTPATPLQECLLSAVANPLQELPVSWAALVLE